MKDLKSYSKQKPSEKFGAYLRSLREERAKLDQAEAARKLDLKRQQLNQYEQGTRVTPYPILIRLAHLYRVATAEVLEKAYWPQLVLLPLIAIVDPEQLSKDLIEELEKGLKEKERSEITRHIKKLLRNRAIVEQH